MKMVAVFLLCFQLSVQAYGGDKAHGGDDLALDFYNSGRLALQMIRVRAKDFSEIQTESFDEILNIARIDIVDKPLYDSRGVLRIAINIPSQQLIRVNKYRWTLLQNDPAKKITMVLHEYLGLLGIEIDHYRISSRLYNLKIQSDPILGVSDVSADVKQKLNSILVSFERAQQMPAEMVDISWLSKYLQAGIATLDDLNDGYEKNFYDREFARVILNAYMSKPEGELRIIAKSDVIQFFERWPYSSGLVSAIDLIDSIYNDSRGDSVGSFLSDLEVFLYYFEQGKIRKIIADLHSKMLQSKKSALALEFHPLFPVFVELHNMAILRQAKRCIYYGGTRTNCLSVGGEQHLIE